VSSGQSTSKEKFEPFLGKSQYSFHRILGSVFALVILETRRMCHGIEGAMALTVVRVIVVGTFSAVRSFLRAIVSLFRVQFVAQN
jgi:hypothetical protein